MLSLRQVEDVCMMGSGATECRYLASDEQGKFFCIKKTLQKDEIDKEVNEFKKKQKKAGLDPKSLGLPLGDNCQGYTFFRHKMQGYDQTT